MFIFSATKLRSIFFWSRISIRIACTFHVLKLLLACSEHWISFMFIYSISSNVMYFPCLVCIFIRCTFHNLKLLFVLYVHCGNWIFIYSTLKLFSLFFCEQFFPFSYMHFPLHYLFFFNIYYIHFFLPYLCFWTCNFWLLIIFLRFYIASNFYG